MTTSSPGSAIRQNYTDALEKALARVVADARRNVEHQAAESRAVIAELKATILTLQAEIRQMVADRLAEIKDGEKGEKGDQGEAIKGPPGEAGLSGRDGKDGSDSTVPGPQGEPGRDGLDGQPGQRGEPGPAGRIHKVNSWSEGISYDGLIVTHKGATYQAIRDTATEPGTSTDWTCIAERGQDARSFNIRGTFVEGDVYMAMDVVACNSGSFAARVDGAGVCPGPDWQLLAGPGKRGDRGLQGLKGDKGSDGMTIVGWKHDLKKYLVIPILTDGSEGPPLSIRQMFQHFAEEVS